MKTLLYLIRHGATEAKLAHPPLLQGRRQNPPLTRLGIRQAEATHNFLAIRPIDHCYCSPLLRAIQTAAIVAAPHGLSPNPLDALTDCDAGRWEGRDWQSLRYLEAEAHRLIMDGPGDHGYPGGESFTDVYRRVNMAIEEILAVHAGQAILLVAHHVVNRIYLAGLLGLSPDQAQQVILDNCGISVAVRQDEKTTVSTLNAAFHLQGVAA